MSSSGSEFNDGLESSHNSSTEDEHSRPASRKFSTTPLSPRKRRRSESAQGIPTRKYHLEGGKYNDAYRILFNEDVNAAAARFTVDESFKPDDAQLGGVKWSAREKVLFFEALERLGKDDIPAISKVIGTKSTQETRQFLLLLQEAPYKRTALRGDSRLRVTLQDIPAAVEIDHECEDILELTGDALAWFQERFEVKQEQARYGHYWLITPEVAEEIEAALRPQLQNSASPATTEAENEKPDIPDPKILQDIPEAKLLKPTEFLYLSKQFFMNPCSTVSYPWPHWTELTSEHAKEPSIYRTAFTDLHTLVVSLTRRIVQAAILQAASRVRSQGWRARHGVQPFVRPRDVSTAVALLGLKRNGHQRWAEVARRCGLRVTDRDQGVHGESQRRVVPWDEVEHLLSATEVFGEPMSTDAGQTPGTDRTDFKKKAMRSGTPLPNARHSSPTQTEEEENESHDASEDEVSNSDENQHTDGEVSDTSSLAPSELNMSQDALEEELDAAEAFDQAASQQAQRQLWDMLGTSLTVKQISPDAKDETQEPEAIKSRKRFVLETDDWRHWTQYRAEWEELRNPVPLSKFLANKKRASFAVHQTIEYDYPDSDAESDRSSGVDEGRKKRRKPVDIPIRSTRAYAEMQGKHSMPENRESGQDSSSDEADVPAQSIENDEGSRSVRATTDNDEMDLE